MPSLRARNGHVPAALVLLLVVLPAAPVGAAFAPGAAAPGDTLSAAVDRMFEGWHRPDSPGAAVLVLRDGEVVHRRGYGMASLEHGVPVRPGTVFDIASVSKQFGAFAVALLEADGRLALDDAVQEYIPELPDFGKTITIRHLVHHTSGLRDWPGTLSMAGWSYEDVMSFEQILRMAFHQQDLNFPPGEEYAYSNTGYNLMAEIVARVSGMSFREFCEERIFAPLDMMRTHFHDDHTEVVPDLAQSYRPAPGGGHRRVTSNLTALGSSSLYTTVDDLARWVLNFEEPRVGGTAVVRRMHERGVLNGGDTIQYAWGQNVSTYRGLRRVTHGGSWAGYRSTLTRFPDQRFTVIILSNVSDVNPGGLADRIAELYLADEMAPAPRVAQGAGEGGQGGGGGPGGAGPEPWQPSAGDLTAYAGTYESRELFTRYRLEVRDGVLVASHFRTGDRVFQPVTPDRFRSPGFGEVRFFRDEAGGVGGFTANQARIRELRFDRVPE
jgi:CubicO group peptidase (beta-lactamase class C family)